MYPLRCQTPQEVTLSPVTGHVLYILHTIASQESPLNLVSLDQLTKNTALFREAIQAIDTVHPGFLASIRDEIEQVLQWIEADQFPDSTNLINAQPVAKHIPIPEDLLERASQSITEEDQSMTDTARFYGDIGKITHHSRALDRVITINATSFYHEKEDAIGPRRDCFDLLRNTPCLLSSYGRFLKQEWQGANIIDVGAGTAEGIVNWAELFEAQSCIYIDHAYRENKHEKRGDMDFYRLKGDARHVLKQLPDNLGSFHVAGMQLTPYGDCHSTVKGYLESLAALIYQKTAPNGILLVGQMHCDLNDEIVRGAGFEPIEINIIPGEMFHPNQHAGGGGERYRFYRKP